MELRQLEYFLAVVEEGGFTRAAARLHVAQPGVSAQVRQLERELGEALLERSARSVRLTEVGAAVLPYARAALAAVAGTRQAVDELTGLVRGRVAMGSVTSSSLTVPDLLADFHRAWPAVEITLVEANSDRLLAALQAGELDLALLAVPAGAPPGIETETVADEPFVAAVAPGDPLAGRTTVAFGTLAAGRDLICLPRGTGVRARLDEAYAAAGLPPRIAFEATDPAVVAHLAARGLGVAVLPRSLVAAHPDTLRAVEIIRPRLRGRLALAWRAGGAASPAARALIAHARTALAGGFRE
ncbi:MAG: LysR family transcriptional regulator [Mycobacteriales bacterium]